MLSNRIGNAFTEKLFTYGISAAEWRVILTLGQYDEVMAKDITERWAMDKMAVSRAIKSLEQKNYIRRDKNSVDNRRFDLVLTRSGNELYEKILPKANDLYYELLSDMDKKQVTDLHDTLIELINHIDSVRKG
jgi:DNA-binding MarR family transcriptional regulator